MPAWLPSLITGVSGILGQGLNAWSQSRNNERMRQFSQDMYKLQRRDALSDWNMQNAYNSPQAQMERFKAAGLNPNLIYGQSNEGGTVRSSSVESWRPEAPQFDLQSVASGSLGAYYDTQLKEAQTNNLEAAIQATQQGMLLTNAQTQAVLAGIPKTNVDTALGQFNLEQLQKAAGMSLEQIQQNLRKTKVDIDLSLQKNEREIIEQSRSLVEAAERILTMRLGRDKTDQEIRELKTRIDNMIKEGQIKDEELKIWKSGARPSDPLLHRKAMELIDRIEKGGGKMPDEPIYMPPGMLDSMKKVSRQPWETGYQKWKNRPR